MSTEIDTPVNINDMVAAAFESVEAGQAAPEAEALEFDEQNTAAQVNTGEPPATSQADDARKDVDTAVDKTAQDSDKVDTDPSAPDTGAMAATEPDRTATAPSSWTRETAAKFAELPADVRAEIHRRETEYHKGIRQINEMASIGHDVQSVVRPYMQTFQQAGIHPLQAISTLLQTEHSLRYGTPEQKAQMMAQIARDYGVDMAQVQPLPPVDPQVQELQRQNQQLQQFQHETLQTQQQAVLSEIQAFGANPANAHFEVVKNDMAALLTSGQATSLQDAYDKAVWMRPDIRKSLVEQQRTEAEKTAATLAREKRAQSAAVGIKGNAPSKGSVIKPGANIRDVVAAAWNGDI